MQSEMHNEMRYASLLKRIGVSSIAEAQHRAACVPEKCLKKRMRNAFDAYLGGLTVREVAETLGVKRSMASVLITGMADRIRTFFHDLENGRDRMACLSTRSKNALEAMGLDNDDKIVDFIAIYGIDEIKAIRNLGEASIAEICEAFQDDIPADDAGGIVGSDAGTEKGRCDHESMSI